MNLEREYITAALDSVHNHLSLLPEHVQRKVELARSLLATHGTATSEELRRELGPNWVIARRSRRIVEQYGADVRCYSQPEFEKAQRRAIERKAQP